MRFHVELSREAQKQLSRFPRDVRDRVGRAIDEFEEQDDSQWSNIKALQGTQWKGRLRKTVGPYRIIFMKFPRREVVEISAILIKSKDTYK
jgi:mRNA-degrading endonuclease RelE of RelBE toxin-antitoxin system